MQADHLSFIICSNNMRESEECINFLKKIHIPQGYEIEIIPIYNATSMASGYNEAMKKSNAKYKVYLHQDTFIINPNFIFELLEVFNSDPNIGMIGCIGRRKMPTDGIAADGWNTGKVYDNIYSLQGYESGVCEVDALDGLLLATQYDIPWREDIFKGWDYYDISQCFEFHRRGLKVVVPEQNKTWCYHDNHYSKLYNYDIWRQKFVEEYQDIYPFEYTEHISQNKREMEELIISLTELLEQYLDSGQMTDFSVICKNPNVENQLWSRDYCLINSIYYMEQDTNSYKRIYQGNAESTLNNIRRLKHLLKRIEYDAGVEEENIREIVDNYSVYAICIVCISYCRERKKIYEKIVGFCASHDLKQQQSDMTMFQDVMTEQRNIDIQHMQQLIVRDKDWKESGEKQVLLIADRIGGQTTKVMRLCRELSEQYKVCLVVQQYEAEILEQLDEMHIETFFMKQPQHLVWDMKDKLYKEFVEIHIVGDSMDRIVEQWHRTHIPVRWYVSQEKPEAEQEYSDNIRGCVL